MNDYNYDPDEGIEGVEEQLLGMDHDDLETQIEGLAAKRGIKFSPVQRRFMASFARRARRVRPPLTRHQKILAGKVRYLNKDEQHALKTGAMQTNDYAHFVRVQFTGANELVNASTTEQYGISTLSDGKMTESMLVSGILLKYGTLALNSNTPGLAPYTNDGNAVLSTILNSELIVSLGSTAIYRSKASIFFSDPLSALSSSANEKQFVQWLQSPKLFRKETGIKVELKIPQGATFPSAADYYLEIAFYGESVMPRVANT